MKLFNPLDELRDRLGLPEPLPAEPMTLLHSWLDDAIRTKKTPNPNAIALATSTPDGKPSVRIVLCKELVTSPPSLVFYTNYTSRKADELNANPHAAAVFHWDHEGKQARMEGRIERVPDAMSDAYFASRPLLSRLAAWASVQSRPLAHRRDLGTAVHEVMKRFGVGVHHLVMTSRAPEIPRPPHWGGYRLLFDRVELWLGGSGRLHDRAVWTRVEPGDAGTVQWNATRLQP